MKRLHDHQYALLNFLKLYPVADRRACLTVLDMEGSSDWDRLLYTLRPLVRHRYITRREDGLYSLLAKGKQTADETIEPLITCGGNAGNRKRAAQIAGVAALFWQHGIPSMREITWYFSRYFIPSPIWRTIRAGLVSTTRFLGMLFFDGQRLAVYDIGDGSMEWQTYAERSLHFRSYGSYETRATGVLMVCDDGMGVEIGSQIIRRTMWKRKTLIKEPNDFGYENPQKRPVSKSPIQIHSDYQHVYLAERGKAMSTLETVAVLPKITAALCAHLHAEENRDWCGRFLENHPDRY